MMNQENVKEGHMEFTNNGSALQCSRIMKNEESRHMEDEVKIQASKGSGQYVDHKTKRKKSPKQGKASTTGDRHDSKTHQMKEKETRAKHGSKSRQVQGRGESSSKAKQPSSSDSRKVRKVNENPSKSKHAHCSKDRHEDYQERKVSSLKVKHYNKSHHNPVKENEDSSDSEMEASLDEENCLSSQEESVLSDQDESSSGTEHTSEDYEKDTKGFGKDHRSPHDASSSKDIRRKNKPHSDDSQLQSTATATTPFVENKGMVKHVVILGTMGSGKYTIAKILSKGHHSFPSRSSLRESGIIQFIDVDFFKFVLIDTGGARMPDIYGAKGPRISDIAAQIKEYLKSGISLIMVVVRYECSTHEDFQILANMINALFTDEARQHIALIHTGYETLSKEHRERYMKNFKRNGPSGQLACLCSKATLAVAFPNLQEVKYEMVEYFKQVTEESKKELFTLIKSCKFLQPYNEILRVNDDPSIVFPQESDPNCCVM